MSSARRAQHEAFMRRALEVARGPWLRLRLRPRRRRGSGGRASAARAARRLRRRRLGRRRLRFGSGSGVGVDVPVGAVVFGPDGEELGYGRNEREATGDPTAHAEMVALRRAADTRDGWRLSDCTLVVTLEPCTMCAGALVLARVGVLVFGAWEPKTGAVGSLWDVVRDPRLNHRPEVYGGVLEAECAALVRSFFRP